MLGHTECPEDAAAPVGDEEEEGEDEDHVEPRAEDPREVLAHAELEQPREAEQPVQLEDRRARRVAGGEDLDRIVGLMLDGR